MSVYSKGSVGQIMEIYDSLPPKLRALIRGDLKIDPTLLIVALEDGMSEDEIVLETKNGRGWWMR